MHKQEEFFFNEVLRGVWGLMNTLRVGVGIVMGFGVGVKKIYPYFASIINEWFN